MYLPIFPLSFCSTIFHYFLFTPQLERNAFVVDHVHAHREIDDECRRADPEADEHRGVVARKKKPENDEHCA